MRSQGPANGPGWGGPAKGAATSRGAKAPKFERGNQAAAGPQRPASETAAELKRTLERIALDEKEMSMVRIKAAEALLNRIEGLPIARNVTIDQSDLTTMDDGQLMAIAMGGKLN